MAQRGAGGDRDRDRLLGTLTPVLVRTRRLVVVVVVFFVGGAAAAAVLCARVFWLYGFGGVGFVFAARGFAVMVVVVVVLALLLRWNDGQISLCFCGLKNSVGDDIKPA